VAQGGHRPYPHPHARTARLAQRLGLGRYPAVRGRAAKNAIAFARCKRRDYSRDYLQQDSAFSALVFCKCKIKALYLHIHSKK